MTEDGDADIESDDAGHVIVSFCVICAVRIEGLANHLRESTMPTGEYFYHLGTATFDEPEWKRRADRLRTTISDFLDLLAPVPRDVLHDPGVFVRLFMTLPSGAATIDSDTVQRLAGVNATIWIDA